MTAIWMLYVVLANGESGPVPSSQYVCELTAQTIATGAKVEADTDFGRVVITAASCLGPVDVEPCEMGEAS